MTEAKLNYKCKLCNLIKQDQELWVEVHNKILKDKLSRTVVVKWLNSRIDILNKSRDKKDKIHSFNNANFSNHFNKHISEVDSMMMKLRDTLTSTTDRGSVSFSEEHKTVANAVLPDKNKFIEEFTILSEMISFIEDSLNNYNKLMKDKYKPEIKPNIIELQKIQGMVNNLVVMKQNLVKLRNSNKITELAIRAAVELTVGSFIEHMLSATEEASNMLFQLLPKDSEIPTQMVSIIRSRIGDNMKFSIPVIINQVLKDYNIK